MITYEYNLDMTQGGLPLKIGLKQYDSDFSLVFKLFARKGTLNITSGTTVKIRGTKPDGTGYSVSASMSGSTVTVTGDQQMTAVAGNVPFELTLMKSGKELNTTTFYIYVERAALDLDTIPSESKIQEIVDLTHEVDEIIAAAESVTEAAESIAAESAQIAANTAGITGLQTALAGVRGMVEDVGDDLYAEGTALSVSATTSNYALKGDGTRISDSNSNLKTYAVTAGKVLHLFLAADNACTYQWQSSSTVPTSGTPSALIGTPVVGAIDAFVKVPAGATHLIVSQLKTNSTNTVKNATCKPDNNAEDIAAIQEELENLDIETDSTLAVQGKPADAKAAGDAISELNGRFGDFSTALSQVDKKIYFATRGAIGASDVGDVIIWADANARRAHTQRLYLTRGTVVSTDQRYLNRICVDEDDVILWKDSDWSVTSRTIEADGYYYLIMAENPPTNSLNPIDATVYCTALSFGKIEDVRRTVEGSSFLLDGWSYGGFDIGSTKAKGVISSTRAHSKRYYFKKGTVISNDRYFVNLVRVTDNNIVISISSGWTSKSRIIETDGYYYIMIADDPITANIQLSDIIITVYPSDKLQNGLEYLDMGLYTLCDNLGTKFYQCGLAFDASSENRHPSHTYSTVLYDDVRKQFIVIYNVMPVHGITNCKMHCRIIKNGECNNFIVIADEVSNGYSMKCHSAGIDNDGNYIAIAGCIRNSDSSMIGIYVYKSSDGGETWTSTEVLLNGSSVTDLYNGDVTGYIKTSTGRIMTWVISSSKQGTILYSDDNGVTWSRNYLTDFQDITEPCFIELDDHTIIAYARKGINSLDRSTPAIFMKSTDDGDTWTKANSALLTDMCNNNACVIKHNDSSGIVEFIYGSRHTAPDGYGSIYHVITTQDMLKNDFGKNPVRIGRFNGFNLGDGGYFGCATSSNNETYVFYYDGTHSESVIKCMHGYYKPINIGDSIYNRNTTKLEFWNGTTWEAVN